MSKGRKERRERRRMQRGHTKKRESREESVVCMKSGDSWVSQIMSVGFVGGCMLGQTTKTILLGLKEEG